MSTHAYVVESRLRNAEGREGTARVYVGSEARAREIASQAPGRSWRAIALDDMPEHARAALVKARSE